MTPESLKNRRLVGVFLLACILFNYPILSLFNLETHLFGIPILYLYVFFIWLMIIVLIVLVTRFGIRIYPETFRNRKP